jgi:hypothetical protein
LAEIISLAGHGLEKSAVPRILDDDGDVTYAHVLPEVRKVLLRSIEERQAFAEQDYWINHKKARAIIAGVADLVKAPERVRPECISVVANPNMGKSTIIKALELEYPAQVKVSSDGTSRIIAPVVTLDTPARATERMLRENMLFALAKEPRIAAAYAKQRLLAFDRFKYHGVKVFAIDNCHRFYNNGIKGRTGLRDFLCEFSEEGFSFVLLGAPNMSKWLEDDEHLRTRMTRRYVIQRFALGRQYEKFLDAVELNLPLRRPSKLSALFTSKFWEATGGSIGETIELARRCCLLAIGSAEERITRLILERVVSR